METQNKKTRVLKGIITSDKMNKTVVVKVSNLKKHPKYKKYFKISAKYKAHDEENEYRTGDRVLIKEIRPISKEKRWIVTGKVASDSKEKSN
ncbi:MAG: 30S ribosomal protein S17 [Candidatus Yanofskybacteria bacterium RIFCSPLOWO2_01_FULL_41_34]|uniref:Small ribosomal subunit protein uS17 n=1 Tax=Candidatus Yanofskybacteria bacterium RIFCSPHIGHO2_01_FULL_41_26 TaxID=1802661 RepID=A0A1F8EBX8_9BACT|nr:MAG: 30S ribosomal protein S17 [Candidatus Yanofskybacteria bacterium RIFCSPHIGHO2_01_FULL_41_26]OGN22362.1 MAG: 30S ribosomal protein S17 [Candidatus Yanofskybacteria bacterium RIFCSPLOWO2_01_FULL_41_34]